MALPEKEGRDGQVCVEECVIRGDAYTWDLGYPVVTDLPDGRLLAARWITTQDGAEPVAEPACVRYIAGTSFRLG